jgi:hypothetical protein
VGRTSPSRTSGRRNASGSHRRSTPAGIGDSSVGWTTEITVEEHTAHAGLVFVVLGGRATAIQVMSADVVTADAMVALAQGAATRLG